MDIENEVASSNQDLSGSAKKMEVKEAQDVLVNGQTDDDHASPKAKAVNGLPAAGKDQDNGMVVKKADENENSMTTEDIESVKEVVKPIETNENEAPGEVEEKMDATTNGDIKVEVANQDGKSDDEVSKEVVNGGDGEAEEKQEKETTKRKPIAAASVSDHQREPLEIEVPAPEPIEDVLQQAQKADQEQHPRPPRAKMSMSPGRPLIHHHHHNKERASSVKKTLMDYWKGGATDTSPPGVKSEQSGSKDEMSLNAENPDAVRCDLNSKLDPKTPSVSKMAAKASQKARKSVQPAITIPVSKTTGQSEIKTVSLHPIANITLKVPQIENALKKVEKVEKIDRRFKKYRKLVEKPGRKAVEKLERKAVENQVVEGKVVKRKRRFKGGTYDLPRYIPKSKKDKIKLKKMAQQNSGESSETTVTVKPKLGRPKLGRPKLGRPKGRPRVGRPRRGEGNETQGGVGDENSIVEGSAGKGRQRTKDDAIVEPEVSAHAFLLKRKAKMKALVTQQTKPHQVNARAMRRQFNRGKTVAELLMERHDAKNATATAYPQGEGTVGEVQLGPVKPPTMGKSLEEVKATLDAADVNGLPSNKRPTRKRKSNIIGEDDSTSMTSTATSTAESDASFIPPTGRVVGRKRKRGRKRLGRPPKSKSQGAQQEFPDGAVSASTNHVAPTSSPLVISQPPTLQQKNPILTLNLIPSAPNVQIGVSSGKQFTVPLLLNQRAPASVGTRGSSQLDRMVYTHPLVGVMGQLPVRPQAGQRSQLAAAASPQNTSQVKPIPSPNAKASPQPRAGATASPAGRQQSQPSAASAHVGTHRNSNVRFATAQNGISYPVTPPKTPENSAGSQSGASPGVVAVAPLPVVQRRFSPQLGSDKDFIPLCCCKLNGASFANLSQVMYCQALDSIDGKVIGCCNKVSNPLLVRPAVKIPFMAVCEVHRKRLRIHQCCPGCGHFCTQGKFYQCKKEGGSAIHLFHRQCQFFKDGKYYCPHCGEESLQFEVNLKIHEPRLVSSFFWKEEANNKKPSSPRAKMSAQLPLPEKSEDTEDEKPSVSLKLDSWEKEISTEKMPLGPARDQLENVLTAMGADKNKKLRCTPKNLYLPSRQGELEKVIYLLSEGFDPDYKFEDHNNQTALHAACTSGYLTIVHVLVAAGASLHITDNGLRTPLMEAVENNNMDVIKYLISCGAKLDWKAEDGMTCLHLAAKEGHIEVMKYLLDTGKIDVNVCDEGGWTPIIWAAEHKHVDAVRFLVLHGADPNIKDNEENTGLHWAAYSGSCDIAELFINAGCNLESANEHGDRALHIAARQDHYECVVLFLARGADNEARNNENETPISVSTNIDPNSQVHLALKVNKQLKGLASKRLQRPERLLHRDISMGREQNPIPVVNQADEEDYPKDFLYIIENIETYPLNINRVITSLQHCNCTDNCSSQFCVCGRNSIKCWYDKAGRLSMEFNKLEPPLIFECNRACACWNTCNNRVVQNGITCRLQVFKTKGRGWGVKTLLDIPQGTFICEYIGELISDSEADNREDDSYLFDLDNKDGDTYCIDARKYANVARFINHLCEPNLIPVKVYVDHQDLRFPRICFFSSRDIKAQEELGFDYGEKFWIIKWKQFTCACGSPKCKYSRETIHQTIADYNRRVQEEEAAQQAE